MDQHLYLRQRRTKVRDISVQGAAGPLKARLYGVSPDGIKYPRLLVFFHGGGFDSGGLAQNDVFLRRLAGEQPGLLILSTEYTLTGDGPFPVAIEDAYSILIWVTRHRSSLFWSGAQLIVAGVEAGANLAAVSNLMTRDRGGPVISAQILLMPMLDTTLSSRSMRALPRDNIQSARAEACSAAYRRYLPDVMDRMHPYASPLQSSRLRGLAPALILAVEGDPLQDEAEQFGAKLISSGVMATVKRLPPLPDVSNAREECAASPRALREISLFLGVQIPLK